MLEDFVVGAMVSAIMLTTPLLWKLGKRMKAKSLEKGRVYYGLLYYRVLLLYLPGVMCGELVSWLVLGDSAEGTGALIAVLLSGIPFTILFTYLYRRRFIKKYLSASIEPVVELIASAPSQQEVPAVRTVQQPATTRPSATAREERDQRLDAQEAYFQHLLDKEKTMRWGIICILLVVAIIVGAITYCLGRATRQDDGGNKDDYIEDKENELAPQERPLSGTILWDVGSYCGALLTVTAHSGSDVVVAVKDMQGLIRKSFFVRAGETATVTVPDTYLYVFFISGTTWYGYGEGLMFGENTVYAMDEDLKDFFDYYEWEYILSPVVDGNFHETPIDKDKFFEQKEETA